MPKYEHIWGWRQTAAIPKVCIFALPYLSNLTLMFKKMIAPLLCWSLVSQSALAQKHDNIWLMGYDATYAPNDSFCVSVFDFSSGVLQVGVNGEMEAFFQETNASLCNAEGQLLAYSNGVHIFNRYHEKMENGSWLVNDVPLESYNMPQGVLMFFMPNNDDYIVLIHPKKTYVQSPVWTTTITKLYYSVIDITANNGAGKAVQKSVPLLTDTLDYGKLTAVRHGNGRDWWIIANEASSNRFYKILLGPEGLSIHDNQAIGAAVPLSLGQAVFSPNGKIFATVGGVDDVEGNFLNVYDFDPCSGMLSNPQQLNWHDNAQSIGMAISPNSRFLYVPAFKNIYQYDLLASDLALSRKTVAIYDGYQSPFGSTFYLAQLAPDNKIYINCPNGETVMHVIHQPDKAGLDCEVAQHGILLPCYNAPALPNFPNYRLGDWPGSPCDSLGINPVSQWAGGVDRFVMFPNPAIDYFTIFRDDDVLPAEVTVSDALGRVVFHRFFFCSIFAS
jgi:hypothetical protein